MSDFRGSGGSPGHEEHSLITEEARAKVSEDLAFSKPAKESVQSLGRVRGTC